MPASLYPAPTQCITPPPLFAVGMCAQIYLDSTQTGFSAEISAPLVHQWFSQRKRFFICQPPLCLCGPDGCGAPGAADFQLCAKSRKPMEKGSGSGQRFFLSSRKASASCSKFLMTTFHLKSSLALKEANFDSTVSQDNLARKYSDEFNILFSFLRWGMSMKKCNLEQKYK